MIDTSWYIKSPGIPVRVAAGGLALLRQNDTWHIALVAEDGHYDYVLPKGGVEKDEELEQAAKREILEEAGIGDLRTIAYLGKKERLNFEKTNWTIIHFFLFVTTQHEGVPTDTKKNFKLFWFPLNGLPGFFWHEQKEFILNKRNEVYELLKAYE